MYNIIMDKTIFEKINEKISESSEDKNQINQIIKALNLSHSNDFALGILVGRIYNSFHYQTKRVLKREPTHAEFLEFVEFLKQRKEDLLEIIRS